MLSVKNVEKIGRKATNSDGIVIANVDDVLFVVLMRNGKSLGRVKFDSLLQGFEEFFDDIGVVKSMTH